MHEPWSAAENWRILRARDLMFCIKSRSWWALHVWLFHKICRIDSESGNWPQSKLNGGVVVILFWFDNPCMAIRWTFFSERRNSLYLWTLNIFRSVILVWRDLSTVRISETAPTTKKRSPSPSNGRRQRLFKCRTTSLLNQTSGVSAYSWRK